MPFTTVDPVPIAIVPAVDPAITSAPWSKGNASTTCEDWIDTMTPAQRYEMSSEVLTQIWRYAGLYFDPESPRIQDFADDVGFTCQDKLDKAPGTFGALTPATDTVLAVMLQVQKYSWPQFLGTPPS